MPKQGVVRAMHHASSICSCHVAGPRSNVAQQTLHLLHVSHLSTTFICTGQATHQTNSPVLDRESPSILPFSR